MNKTIAIIGGIVLGVFVLMLGSGLFFMRAMDSKAEEGLFVISRTNQLDTNKRLQESGYIRSPLALTFARLTTLRFGEIQPGGYKLSKSKDARKLITILTSEPQLKWITIPEGLRKEEIGERLAKEIHWDNEALEKWNTTYTAMEFDYREGVYFPDTYLIPVGENGLDTAKRMINRFNERFAGYPEKFAEQNVLWTSALKIASIVQREAAGKEDMPLIAGILWNRLLNDQPLEIDATIQYARGNTGSGWWAPIKASDIDDIDSPYNTYKHKGLPPTPISNPGIDAIDAVLNPTETDCYYYLHDKDRQIHCAKTLEEHEANIDKYLK
ncbi:MAG: putative aminodeoxychorismate lyase [Microgenomates group bacterium ADurb.Bin219]|nr:MAG: putative aminodeoxychorismate lyase [Microgenomates group bacterium ADurb.Bin219]